MTKIKLELTQAEAASVRSVLIRGEVEIVDGDIEGGTYEYDRPGLRKTKNDIQRVREVRRRIEAQQR